MKRSGGGSLALCRLQRVAPDLQPASRTLATSIVFQRAPHSKYLNDGSKVAPSVMNVSAGAEVGTCRSVSLTGTGPPVHWGADDFGWEGRDADRGALTRPVHALRWLTEIP